MTDFSLVAYANLLQSFSNYMKKKIKNLPLLLLHHEKCVLSSRNETKTLVHPVLHILQSSQMFWHCWNWLMFMGIFQNVGSSLGVCSKIRQTLPWIINDSKILIKFECYKLIAQLIVGRNCSKHYLWKTIHFQWAFNLPQTTTAFITAVTGLIII